MRLRRLEIIFIGLTLAFACFIGGFFAGRNWNAVNITAVATQNGDFAGTISVSDKSPEPAAEVTVPVNKTDTPAAAAPDEKAEPAQQQVQAGAPRGGDGKININRASHAELTDLPGIGNALAARIVDYRTSNGDFSCTEDIRNVSGIGEKRFEAIKDKITVG